jgi:hypothetical protein
MVRKILPNELLPEQGHAFEPLQCNRPALAVQVQQQHPADAGALHGELRWIGGDGCAELQARALLRHDGREDIGIEAAHAAIGQPRNLAPQSRISCDRSK